MSHLIEMSNITTRANNQFPRPDFHRLDKQPYRLQPLPRGTPRRLRQGVDLKHEARGDFPVVPRADWRVQRREAGNLLDINAGAQLLDFGGQRYAGRYVC